MNNLYNIVICIALIIILIPACSSSTRIVKVDFNSNNGLFKDLNGVNIGPDGSFAGYHDAGISMIRTHNYDGPFDYWDYTDFYDIDSKLFNYSFDPDNPGHYNWANSDLEMDNILKNGFTPYFRLGISLPGENKELNNPPFDSDGHSFSTFARLCLKTVIHYTTGCDEVYRANIPYWEVWNEPDNEKYWLGTDREYYRMYKAVSKAIKEYSLVYKVGGPGAVFHDIVKYQEGKSYNVVREFFIDFIKFCKDYNVALDFYSWHLYGRKNPYSVNNYANMVRQVLDQYGFYNTESHITEIRNGDSQSEIFDNTPKAAAYTASLLITAQHSPVNKIFWHQGSGFNRLFKDDTADENSNLTYNALGIKAMNRLYKNTPIILSSSGNHVIDYYSEIDTTNFMVTAGKSHDKSKVYLLISNYNSFYNSIYVAIDKLPWISSDTIEVTKYTIDKNNFFTSSTVSDYRFVRPLLSFKIDDADSPSVFLIEIEKK